MKRRLMLMLLLMLSVPLLANDETCMDCVQRFQPNEVGSGEGTLIATCCMAMDGHCFEEDWIEDADVGWGCKVSEADDDGNTNCVSSESDKGCPRSGGGGGGTKGGGGIGESCVYDATGYCDVSCGSCSWG